MAKRQDGVSCLFSSEDRKLDNIKFYRQSSAAVSVEQFEAEICASIKRQEAPGAILSRTPPRCKKEPIDLERLVAEM